MSPLGQNMTTGIEVEEIENEKRKRKKKAFLPSFLRKSHPVKVLQHLSLSPCPCIPLKGRLKAVKVIHLCAQSFSPNVIFH